MTASPLAGTAAVALGDRYTDALLTDPGAHADLAALAARADADPTLQTTSGSRLLLRPMFLRRDERDELERDLAALQGLLLSLPSRLYDGRVHAMCADLGFGPAQTHAVERTWLDADVLLSRADLLRGPDGFQAVEVNLHSSLGGIDSGPWHRAYLESPRFAAFAATSDVSFVDPMDGVAGALLAAARKRGLGSFPTVAVVDWPTSYRRLQPRLDRLALLLGRRGLDAFSCHAGELRLRNGGLYARDRRIDVVHRIFVLEDIPSSPALLKPLLAAHGAGRVALAMSFLAELIGNKGTLAMLHDPRHATAFTAEERSLVSRIVPLTRWAGEWPNGLGTELSQSDLVLKPASGYAARGVLAGWSASRQQWERQVDRVRRAPWVLQQRVRTVPERVPVLAGDRVAAVPMDVNWGVFLAGDRFDGAMVRAVPTRDARLITTTTDASIGGCYVARS